jgi:hypothetical protein
MRNVLATAMAMGLLAMGMTTAYGLPRRPVPIPDGWVPSPAPNEDLNGQFNGSGPGAQTGGGFYEEGGDSESYANPDDDVAALRSADGCMQAADCSGYLPRLYQICSDGSTAAVHFECIQNQCRMVLCGE